MVTRNLTLNGIEGYKVSSKRNNNFIFLPASGSLFLSNAAVGPYGMYWSSTLNLNDNPFAFCLDCSEITGIKRGGAQRFQSVYLFLHIY